MREDSAKVRAGKFKEIATEVGQDIAAVARALRSVKLWDMPDSLEGELAVVMSGGPRTFAYSLPDGYRPDAAFPLLVSWAPAPDALDQLHALRGKTGDALERFVLVGPQSQAGATEAFASPATVDLMPLLRALRIRFSIDSDRVFLLGEAGDAPAAWSIALGRPDVLAGALYLSSIPGLPYPDQSYPLLLPNLKNLPVLLIWAESNSADARQALVGLHNKAILALAHEQGLPISGRKLESTENVWDRFSVWADGLTNLLAHRRAPIQADLTHWFRFPHQGRAGWIRSTSFRGEVWMENQQLSIKANAGADRGQFVRDVLESRLGMIRGQIDQGTITIQTRRCGGVEILWPLGGLGVTGLRNVPTTILCNGRRRHFGGIKPNVRTLLEQAYETWDFQRLFVARLPLSIKQDAKD